MQELRAGCAQAASALTAAERSAEETIAQVQTELKNKVAEVVRLSHRLEESQAQNSVRAFFTLSSPLTCVPSSPLLQQHAPARHSASEARVCRSTYQPTVGSQRWSLADRIQTGFITTDSIITEYPNSIFLT